MIGSLIYLLLRVLMDVLATRHRDQADLQAEVLALRRQIQVLQRQIKRVEWSPGDRMVLAALRGRISRSGWAALLVKPETVLGWHRALVRNTPATPSSQPRCSSPPPPTYNLNECAEDGGKTTLTLTQDSNATQADADKMARDNWGLTVSVRSSQAVKPA